MRMTKRLKEEVGWTRMTVRLEKDKEDEEDKGKDEEEE